MAFRFSGASDWLDRSSWLFVLLVLLMLLPAAVVLWFMNEAIATRTAAAERSVREAYRGQLRLVRDRVDEHWQRHGTRLRPGDDPPAFFARTVVEGTADAIVVLHPDGTPLYPSLRGGDASLASALARELEAPGVDVGRIAATLNDHGAPLDGPTRLALMQQLRAVEPNVKLPTQAGLRLARDWIEAGAVVPESGSFHETAIPGVWGFTSDDRRAVALYRTGRLESLMHDLLHEVEPEGINFIAFPPGVPADTEAVAAGMWMPGWQLSYVPLDTRRPQDDARRETWRYLLVGAAGIVMIAALGATVGRGFLQQFRLARLKTDLVAAVSHELRTPLASIRVLVDGLLEDRELDPGKTREYLALIATENARLHRLVENFLTFSRLDRGRYRFEFAPIAPSTVVQAAVAAIRDRLPDGREVRVEIAPGLPPLRADAAAVETALVNLLDNAIKYTPDDKRIHVRAQCDQDGFVSLVVEDNGIGIPAGEQRHIFTRFYRVDRRLARETGGVGLGLSIVDLVARAHGGSVSVRSVAGEGASFTLRLPCAAQGAAA